MDVNLDKIINGAIHQICGLVIIVFVVEGCPPCLTMMKQAAKASKNESNAKLNIRRLRSWLSQSAIGTLLCWELHMTGFEKTGHFTHYPFCVTWKLCVQKPV